MTAPDKIWAGRVPTEIKGFVDWSEGEWTENDASHEGYQLYHHQRTVDELVEALGRLEQYCSSYAAKVGPQHAWWDGIFDARAALARYRGCAPG